MRAGTLRTPALWLAALALVATAGTAMAQGPSCTISGPPEGTCGPVELCGPEGNYSYYWARPFGGIEFTRCITAIEEGGYLLYLTDNATGQQGEPCEYKLGCEKGTDCTIDGPKEFCAGDKVELCGPTGDYTYHWSGPGGVDESTRCISASEPGTYTLELSFPDGSGKSTCTHELEEKSEGCTENCPRTVGFWGSQCAQKNNGSTKFTKPQVTSIASCVDGKSAFFSWADDFAGFCAAISTKDMNQRVQAKRQYAGMLANICTGELGLIANNGNEIKLDPATVINCGGTSQTISELISFIESELAALEGQNIALESVKNRYTKIITCADNINNGRGIGSTCSEIESSVLSGTLASGSAELALQPNMDLGSLRAFPNPFKSVTRLSYAVAPSGERVTLGVYDIAGRQVKQLFDGFQSGGVHESMWNGTDAAGARARSGMYFIRGKVGERVVASRVMMVE